MKRMIPAARGTRQRSRAVIGSTGVLTALCVGVALLAGCSPEMREPSLTDPNGEWQGGQVTGSAAPNPSPAERKNIASWVLPLDEFVSEYGNLDNYAEQLLLASCLGDQDIEWPVPWQDIEEPASPVVNAAGTRLFNSDIAGRYGFRTNVGLTESGRLWESFLAHQPTESGFQDAFDECLTGIREQHPIVDTDDQMFVRGLMYEAMQDAFLDSQVQEAAARWRSCMEPQGFGQLPENPTEFPGQELQQSLGSVPPLSSPEPSARELEVAVAHAACLDSSGFSATLYETQWALQATALERERTKLDNIRDEVQARESAVQEIISANAPRA